MSFNLYSDLDNHHTLTNMCVVIDLDATLISTQDSFDDFKKLNIMKDPNLLEIRRRCYCIKLTDIDTVGDGSRYDFWGIKRHYLDEFILFCFNYFKYVLIWSAGKKNYVEAIVDNIFKNFKKPHLVWTHDDIVFDDDENGMKPLAKLMASPFGKKHKITAENTLFIDDNEVTFVKNKKNAVYIPGFDPEPIIESLSEINTDLLKLKYFLLLPHVRNADDVTKLDLSNIFKYSYEDYKNIANSYN